MKRLGSGTCSLRLNLKTLTVKSEHPPLEELRYGEPSKSFLGLLSGQRLEFLLLL